MADEAPGSATKMKWQEYKITNFCDALEIQDVTLRNMTFGQLMRHNDEALAQIAGGDFNTQSALRQLREHTENYKFWADSLDDNQQIFSLGSRNYFVITPQLLQTLPQSAKEQFPEDEYIKTHPVEALREVFEVLADAEVDCGRFGLPMLDLDHREEALNDLAQLVGQLHSGKANGNGRTGRILLGPKGTGKSAFMQALAIAAALLYPGLTVVYINYAPVVHSKSPISPAKMLYYAYLCSKGDASALANSSDFLPGERWEWHHTYNRLLASEQRFLIIADEFNKVYSVENLGDVVAHFHSIGMATEGRVSAVLSGSSAALFNLCYAHIDGDTRANYPSYNGVSLNSGRYTDLRMKPARSKEQFQSVLKHILQAAKQGHKDHQFFNERDLTKIEQCLSDERRCMQLYAITGGKFRYLKESFDNDNDSDGSAAYSALVRRIVREFGEQWTSDKQFVVVMKKLVEKKDAICAAVRENKDTADKSFWAEVWLEAKDLAEAGLTEHHIYELGDKNLLFVDSTKAGLRVTFETGIQEDLCRARMEKVSLDAYCCICLRYPYGQLGIDAEDLVLKSLSHNCQKAGLPATKHGGRRFSMLPCINKNRSKILQHLSSKDMVVCGSEKLLMEGTSRIVSKTREKLKRLQSTLPQNEFFKEHPDIHGADAILFTKETTSLCVKRFQIKLGKSEIDEKAANEIVSKLQKGDVVVRKILEVIPECPEPIIEHYLITTRTLKDKANMCFKDNNVTVLGRKEMYQVWLDDIKQFDCSIGLGMYCDFSG
ncbi:hypothetical protein QOT17_005500 [Balamuthia mandrillaris]